MRLVTLFSVALGGNTALAATHYHQHRAVSCPTFTLGNLSEGANLVESAGFPGVPSSKVLASEAAYIYGHCQVRLPDDALIKKVTAYGEDHTIDHSVQIQLRRARYDSEDFEVLTEVWSEETSDVWDSDPIFQWVDNDDYTYVLFFWLHSQANPLNLQLWNLEVEYATP